MAPIMSDLAPPFLALAALLPNSKLGLQEEYLSKLEQLSDEEVESLLSFQSAGQQCLAHLKVDTLALLHEADIKLATSDGELMDEPDEASDGQPDRICTMFEMFDTDADGLLTLDEFRGVLLQVGAGAVIGESELEGLALAADKNNDGFIDLQEFTEMFSEQLGALGGNAQEDSFPSSPSEEEKEKRRVEKNLRRQLCQTREDLEAAQEKLTKLEQSTARELRRAEQAADWEMDGLKQLWRSIAETSAAPALSNSYDLNTLEVLGHGKYGFVFKCFQKHDGKEEVLKLLSVRWAASAAKEWRAAQSIESHPDIVQYGCVLLHADQNRCIAELLQAAQEQGKIQLRTKRAEFPDRYLCLTQEYMNSGTVQMWINEDRLLPGGVLVVMQSIARGIAHLHKCGYTHNDLKPANVLIHRVDPADVKSKIMVKLADLGLAEESTDRTADFVQYGMTVLCMATGEPFGTRKFQPEAVDELVAAVSDLTGDRLRARTSSGYLSGALAEIPGLLRKIWTNQLTMAEVRDQSFLQGWEFFDEETTPRRSS